MNTRTGFIVATSEKEADQIAQSRPDLIHKNLRSAQDQMRCVRGVEVVDSSNYGVYVVNVGIQEPEVKA